MRNLGKILLVIAALAFALSAGIMVFNMLYDIRADNESFRVSWELSEQIRRNNEERHKTEDPDTEPDEDDEPEDEPAAEAEPSAPEPTPEIPSIIELDGEMYMGLLRIPSLSLELPVNNESSEEKLDVSPCRFYGDIHESLVIGAHNIKSHFRRIPSLSKGDEVVILDTKGFEHHYVVEDVTQYDNADVDAVNISPYDLTLTTCTASRTERIAVRCSKANTVVSSTPNAIIITDDPAAPKEPRLKIDYKREILKVKKDYLYSLDGTGYIEVTGKRGVILDVSEHIKNGTPIYVRKAATKRKPASKAQVIYP